MDCKDLDLYLLARRQQKVIYVITAVALAVVTVSGALLLFGVTTTFVKTALIGCSLGILLANSEFGLSGMPVSRRALLGLLENQINRDASALAYVSKKC